MSGMQKLLFPQMTFYQRDLVQIQVMSLSRKQQMHLKCNAPMKMGKQPNYIVFLYQASGTFRHRSFIQVWLRPHTLYLMPLFGSCLQIMCKQVKFHRGADQKFFEKRYGLEKLIGYSFGILVLSTRWRTSFLLSRKSNVSSLIAT